MGRCSATEVFDPVVEFILEQPLDKIDKPTKAALITVLVQTLEDYDWDCQDDSAYYGHPLVRQVFKALHPRWFDDA